MNNLLDIKTPAQGEASAVKSDFGLDNLGLSNLRMAYWNLPTEALYEEITFRREARIAHNGPIIVNTGKHTARSANDKFVVRNRPPKTTSGGANTTGRSTPTSSTICTTVCRGSCRDGTCSCRTAMPVPIRTTVCPSVSSPSTPGIATSRATCSSCRATNEELRQTRSGVHRHRRPLVQGHPADRQHRDEHVHRA